MSKGGNVKNRRSAGETIPLIEPLEPRLLLSGNVTVFTIGTGLFAYGDVSANDILIEQGVLHAGLFTVTGRNATTVNETAAGTPVEFPDINGDLWAWMSDGNDVLEVKGATVPGLMWVDGGAGDNTVTIDPTTINGSVFVMNGVGLDTFSMTSSQILGSLTILNGDGGSNTTLDGGTVDGSVTVFNGAGSDSFLLDNSSSGDGIYAASSSSTATGVPTRRSMTVASSAASPFSTARVTTISPWTMWTKPRTSGRVPSATC